MKTAATLICWGAAFLLTAPLLAALAFAVMFGDATAIHINPVGSIVWIAVDALVILLAVRLQHGAAS